MTGCPILHGPAELAFALTVLLMFATGDDSDWRRCVAKWNDPKRRKLWIA